MVVRRVVEELERRLAEPDCARPCSAASTAPRATAGPGTTRSTGTGRSGPTCRHYQPEYRTIIPETRIGYGRKRQALREIVLCIDQSGSMATSVVYAGIFGAVLACLPALKTQVVVFDTAVVDLTDELDDPVELLFGTQLGGGTDINRALAYCQGLIAPARTTRSSS